VSGSYPTLFCTRCGTRLVEGRCPECEGSDVERVAYRATNLRLGLWLGFFVLFVGGANLLGYELTKSDPQPKTPDAFGYSFALYAVLTYAVFAGVILLLSIGMPKREAFGLKRPTSWRTVAWAVPMTIAASLVFAGIVEKLLHPGREQGVTPDKWVSGHTLAYALSFIAVAVIAPVVEELAFRGIGYSLFRRFGEWPAIFGVGTAFALAHGIPASFVALVPLGCALTFMRSRLKSVYPGMITHGVYNAIVMLAIFLQ
jgi:membrane protease YdiL (CAAX protease family)